MKLYCVTFSNEKSEQIASFNVVANGFEGAMSMAREDAFNLLGLFSSDVFSVNVSLVRA